jgi:hypothetical protein
MPWRLNSSTLTGQVQNASEIAGGSAGLKHTQYAHLAQESVQLVMMSWVPTARRTPQMFGHSSDRHAKLFSHLVVCCNVSSSILYFIGHS